MNGGKSINSDSYGHEQGSISDESGGEDDVEDDGG